MAHLRPTAILTRPAGRNTALVRALGQAGWPTLECPALDIQSVPILPARVAPRPEAFDLVVFVSRAAVAGYQHQLPQDFAWPAHVAAACMGPVTAGAVRRTFGADLIVLHPEGAVSQDSEALWPLILAQPSLPRKVLILRGQDGREWLSEKLLALGVAVTVQQTYQREVASWPDPLCVSLRELATEGRQAVWLLTSVHGIQAIVQKLHDLTLLTWFERCTFVVTHERLRPVLAKALGRELGQLCHEVASPEDEAIVLCFDQIFARL
ncbi:MAG: uroporphyrinogen-III synthase [Candidatus Methylopumilus sp.]|nr:uroporphyrinogen-III synthase [Candidatus Methylopumilus sp.]